MSSLSFFYDNGYLNRQRYWLEIVSEASIWCSQFTWSSVVRKLLEIIVHFSVIYILRYEKEGERIWKKKKNMLCRTSSTVGQQLLSFTIICFYIWLFSIVIFSCFWILGRKYLKKKKITTWRWENNFTFIAVF